MALHLRLATFDRDLDASLDALRRDPSRVAASRALVEAALADGAAHYGVNTGFGALQNVRIAPEHVAAPGEPAALATPWASGAVLPEALSRTMLLLDPASPSASAA